MLARSLLVKSGDTVKLWGALCASLGFPATKTIFVQKDEAIQLPTWAVKCQVNTKIIYLKRKLYEPTKY